MGDVKRQRVDSALSSLIDNLISRSPNEDSSTSNKGRDDALEWAKTVVHGHVRSCKIRCTSSNFLYSRGEPEVVSDVNHASDLIKKKCKAMYTSSICAS